MHRRWEKRKRTEKKKRRSRWVRRRTKEGKTKKLWKNLTFERKWVERLIMFCCLMSKFWSLQQSEVLGLSKNLQSLTFYLLFLEFFSHSGFLKSFSVKNELFILILICLYKWVDTVSDPRFIQIERNGHQPRLMNKMQNSCSQLRMTWQNRLHIIHKINIYFR